jgi:hypothetical protein
VATPEEAKRNCEAAIKRAIARYEQQCPHLVVSSVELSHSRQTASDPRSRKTVGVQVNTHAR